MSINLPLSAEELTYKLDGKWNGTQGTALCPAHDDYKPSLSISDNPNGGNPLAHCHAGCSQDAVIDHIDQKGLWARGNGSDFANIKAQPRANKSPRADQPKLPDNQKKATADREDQSIWNSCKPAPQDHPYLRKKQIEAYGARVDNDNRLVVPLNDTEGEIYGFQHISPNGDKIFPPGSKVKGHFYPLGLTS